MKSSPSMKPAKKTALQKAIEAIDKFWKFVNIAITSVFRFLLAGLRVIVNAIANLLGGFLAQLGQQDEGPHSGPVLGVVAGAWLFPVAILVHIGEYVRNGTFGMCFSACCAQIGDNRGSSDVAKSEVPYSRVIGFE